MADFETEIKGWFSTPIATVRFPDHAPLDQALVELFQARESDAFRHHIKIPTQVGPLFESRFDLFDWPDPPVQQLADLVHDALSGMIAALNGYSDEQIAALEFTYESWFHITRTGGYQSWHIHPNACWSGIYCVDPGDSVAERPESGQVKFYDPRGATAQMYFDAGLRQMDPRFSWTPIYLTHQAGQLVMFPSWLGHEVLPYVGQRDRIVVAFNASVVDADPEPGFASEP